MSSIGQSPVDFDDVMMEKSWPGGRVAYTQSKLAQVLFTLSLAEHLAGRGVTVTALHPATFMATGMVTKAGITPASTVAEGAEAILALAVGPQHAATTGKFFNGLKEARANEQAYDPAAKHTAHEILGDTITYADDPYQAVEGADVLCLVTEWSEFTAPDWERVWALMRDHWVYDGRNLWEPREVVAQGFKYRGIGRR